MAGIISGSAQWYRRLMTGRLQLAMGRAGVNTFDELSRLTERQFRRTSRVGNKTVAEAKEQLGFRGLTFRIGSDNP